MKKILMKVVLLIISFLVLWSVGTLTSNINELRINPPVIPNEKISTSSPAYTVIRTPTNTATPSRTPLPSNTPTPVPSRTPTITQSATPTSAATLPVQVYSILEDAHIIFYDRFEMLDNRIWSSTDTTKMSNSQLDFTTISTDTSFRRNRIFREGEGVFFDFKYTKQIAAFDIAFSSGISAEPTYRSFGIHRSRNTGFQDISIFRDNRWSDYATKWTKPEVWYRVVMGIDKNGELLLRIWEKNKPTSWGNIFYDRGDKQYSGRDWNFWLRGRNDINQITVSMANYFELQFKKFK